MWLGLLFIIFILYSLNLLIKYSNKNIPNRFNQVEN